MRKQFFTNGGFCHIFNRGVDKRTTFMDSSDYARFLNTLYVCNDIEKKTNNHIERATKQNGQGSTLTINRQRLVDILCFSLMPNHYHLLLKQLVEGGISTFMHRVGTAYTMYFNIKRERSGVLFQGRFKAKLITSDDYLLQLSRYIHLNPVELIEPGWKERGIKNWEQVNNFLESYKWSSYQDHVGIKNFPSIINKSIMKDFYNNSKEYKGFINNFVQGSLQQIKNII